MADISSLIDRRIDETFIIKAPKSYTANRYPRKPTTTMPPKTSRPKNLITPKMNIKEDKSLLIRAAKTRGETHENYRTDASTSLPPTGQMLSDP